MQKTNYTKRALINSLELFLNCHVCKTFITLGIGKLRINQNNRGYLSKGTSYIGNLDYICNTNINWNNKE